MGKDYWPREGERGGDGGQAMGGLAPTARDQWARAFQGVFQGCREGATCRNSTVSSGSLEAGHQWSDQRCLDCFQYSESSVRGWFAPISLRPFLRVVAAYVMTIVCSSCS